MGRPVILAENFYNTVQFTGHAVSASSEAAGTEAWRVGTARRDATNRWIPATGTENTAHWLAVACDRVRGANMLVFDRGHNLAGHAVALQASGDAWATYEEIFAFSLPSAVFAPANANAAPGVLTEEGAWLYRFPARAARYWRVYVPAMGAGLKPQLVGVYLGLSFRLGHPLDLPFDWGLKELEYDEIVSNTLWSGSSAPAQRRRGTLVVRLSDQAEYDLARYHIEEQFLRGRFSWLLHDDARAERALLVRAPRGVAGFRREPGWAYMQAEIPYFEHEPAQI